MRWHRTPSRTARWAGSARAGRALLCAVLCVPTHAVRAQEPLYLRIRANPEARLDGTPAAGPTTEAGPGPAAREAVWERSERRARIAIASVCTGCLAPRSALRAFMPSSVAEAPASDPPPTLPPTAGDP